MNEDLLKLIENMESDDAVIRNLSSNIFLNIKDDSEFNEVYERVKSSGAFVKSFFIKLLAVLKKESSKRLLVRFLNDRDISIRKEAAAAINKISKIFNPDDLQKMLRSESPRENSAAIEILAGRKNFSQSDEIYSLFLDYPQNEERIGPFIEALKFAVTQDGRNKKLGAKVINIMKSAFSAKNLKVFEICCRWAHVLIPDADIVENYSRFILKDAAFDEIIVASLMHIPTPICSEMLETVSINKEFALGLRKSCFQKLLSAKEPGFMEKGIGLYCRDLPQSLKYIGMCAILNNEKPALEKLLKKNATAVTREPSKYFENIILLDSVVSKTAENMQFFLEEYKKPISSELRGIILAALWKKKLDPGRAALDTIENNYEHESSRAQRYFMITALVSFADGIRLSRIFAKCQNNPYDFAAFAEAYIKRCQPGIEDRSLYSRFLAALFKYYDLNLIAHAVACMPAAESSDYIHEFIKLLDEVHVLMFNSMLKMALVSILLNNPQALEKFLDGIAENRLSSYVSILKETLHFNAVKAYVRRFFNEDGTISKSMNEHLSFMLKDSIYIILKNNPDRIYDLCDLPQFKHQPFVDFISPIVLNALEDLLVRGDTDFEDLSFLIKKNPRSLEFYKQMTKSIGYENKFFLFNILQKYGKNEAMELIAGLNG
ncbi:MAG TPA: HEAT repeat domain-containing protein [Candidatus Wallbacteria bacterium]|nr:HEAT repeat domain-containing protein [Candidatus Wallbacteria bacterium]